MQQYTKKKKRTIFFSVLWSVGDFTDAFIDVTAFFERVNHHILLYFSLFTPVIDFIVGGMSTSVL